MTCLGCWRCEDQTARLIDGREVCAWCPDWMLECEARFLLSLPLSVRQTKLSRMAAKGRDVARLKAVMTEIHQKRLRDAV